MDSKGVSSIGVLVIAGFIIGFASLTVFMTGIGGFTEFVSQGDESQFNELASEISKECKGNTASTGSAFTLEFKNTEDLEIKTVNGNTEISATIEGDTHSSEIKNCETDMSPNQIDSGKWYFEIACVENCDGSGLAQVDVEVSGG